MDRHHVRLTPVLLAALPLAVLGVFFVLPVGEMLRLGLAPHGRLDLGGVVGTLTRPRVVRVLWFTVWAAAAATVVTVALGVPTAYALHRLRLPGSALLRGVVTAPFVLPTVVVGVAFRGLLAPSGPLGGLGLDGTPVAIIAALVFFNLSVVVRTVGPSWAGLDPRRGEAAAALGATPWQVLRTVTLPALRPAAVSSAMVVFLFCATAFGVVLTMGGGRYSTVETEIYYLTTQLLDLPAAAALSVLQLAVVVGLLALTGRARPGEQSDRTAPVLRRPRRSDAPVLAVTAVVLAFVVAPLAAVLVRSLRVDGAWSTARFAALERPPEDGTLRVPLSQALETSLRVAVDATLLAMVLGLVVAGLTARGGSRRWRRLRSALDGVFMLPLGVSAVTVGFGLLVALDTPPLDLRGSPWLVPVAQALVALPLVVRLVAPALRSVDPRLREAAASLGARPSRVLGTVDLPLVWRPVLSATGFAFAVSLGEFGATSFLARPDDPTLPVLVYQLVSRPGAESFGAGLAAAVVLGLVTSVVVVAVERLRPPGVGAF
ncbi:ABC transporter permease [Nocardioides marmoribigeumensis]|uniref:Thiamine transport system permease protein n=1 Tax=Nocardioides marmoribigeumensis TaxID=433649 RepID=A0ABU2BT14_9ACTN|nr:iron ABC transporter permease [Nocardioides marmoribigeumensis]MDR7361770.1 thiamine transport system permease protein [Nocardioides marmoribigeumensis]